VRVSHYGFLFDSDVGFFASPNLVLHLVVRSNSIYGYGVGKVVRSEHSGYSKGDYVTSLMMGMSCTTTFFCSRLKKPWNPEHAEYWIPTKDDIPTVKKFTPEPGLPLSVYLGAAGMPGKSAIFKTHCSPTALLNIGRTAYIAWQMYAKAKKGEVCFVSAGAGMFCS